MRNIIPFLFMIIFFDMGMTQTQGEMNAEMQKSYNSNKELNAIYPSYNKGI